MINPFLLLFRLLLESSLIMGASFALVYTPTVLLSPESSFASISTMGLLSFLITFFMIAAMGFFAFLLLNFLIGAPLFYFFRKLSLLTPVSAPLIGAGTAALPVVLLIFGGKSYAIDGVPDFELTSASARILLFLAFAGAIGGFVAYKRLMRFDNHTQHVPANLI